MWEVFGREVSVEQAVEEIIAAVGARGDAAVLEYGRRIEGREQGALEVSREEIAAARRSLDAGLAGALAEAAERIRDFHRRCVREGAGQGWFDAATGLGQAVRPLERVGVYVPGGTAAYPSTVLHTVIPARVAGVKSVVIASPPGVDGRPSPVVLAAAAIAGADGVLAMGGAQAIAAMALGTESVPRVDKIVGPGNIFVTMAKRKVFGLVGIDGLHGPTETLLIVPVTGADAGASAAVCAADLLAQAEHDALATPVLLTNSAALAAAVEQEVLRQVRELSRREMAEASWSQRGCIGVVGTVEEAIEIANEFAPEHLCLMTRDAERYLPLVRNAGGVFLGRHAPEVLGDYNAGPSHVMPTGGTARFASALGVQDFMKTMSIIALPETTGKALAGGAARIALAEGLTAHARSARMRAGEGDGGTR
ncbi:MAG: histidinol dehydrogenase [Dehalococcoidia bacterium]|nr:histidinol dehydrogenase [Dehalococcoidia bacterium]